MSLKESKTIQAYGHPVSVPSTVQLPCPVYSDATQSIVDVTTGGLPSPRVTFDLDDLVTLEFEGSTASVRPKDKIGVRACEHYLVDHAVPHALTMQNKYVFHAAGLLKESESANKRLGIMITGESGTGKSSTAASLLNYSWKLLADDGLHIDISRDKCRMHPSYASIRLNPDVRHVLPANITSLAGRMAEYSDKLRFDISPAGYRSQAAQLDLLIVLGEEAKFNVTELGASEVCVSLAKHLFHPPSDPSKAIERLDIATPLAVHLRGVKVDFFRSARGIQDLKDWLSEYCTNNDLQR